MTGKAVLESFQKSLFAFKSDYCVLFKRKRKRQQNALRESLSPAISRSRWRCVGADRASECKYDYCSWGPLSFSLPLFPHFHQPCSFGCIGAMSVRRCNAVWVVCCCSFIAQSHATHRHPLGHCASLSFARSQRLQGKQT